MATKKETEVRVGATVVTGDCEGGLALPAHTRRPAATEDCEDSQAIPAASPDPRRRAKADEIKRLYREGIVGIVGAGGRLRDLKQEMLAGAGAEKVEGYREFRAFCEDDLGWPKSMVNRLIDVANAFGDYLDLVTRFDLSALYALSRATPEQREQALERARKGEFVSNKAAAELIRPGKAGAGKAPAKKPRPPKDYEIPLPNGSVVVTAPHRTLAEVRAALLAALEVLDARLAKRRRTPVTTQ